jgi:hypothetical protein
MTLLQRVHIARDNILKIHRYKSYFSSKTFTFHEHSMKGIVSSNTDARRITMSAMIKSRIPITCLKLLSYYDHII